MSRCRRTLQVVAEAGSFAPGIKKTVSVRGQYHCVSEPNRAFFQANRSPDSIWTCFSRYRGGGGDVSVRVPISSISGPFGGRLVCVGAKRLKDLLAFHGLSFHNRPERNGPSGRSGRGRSDGMSGDLQLFSHLISATVLHQNPCGSQDGRGPIRGEVSSARQFWSLRHSS
jgi:hypothetical protein